jgi:hypothetical protein
MPAEAMNLILSGHARNQLAELGDAAEDALCELRSLELDDVPWVAEELPPRHGRRVWMLWASEVRVLFDTEGEDLTVQGFGKRPRSGF